MKIGKNLVILALVFISIIPLFGLLQPGLPITHDGQDHVARIANFYQNLKEGNLIPRWAGNLNWGYGHPVLMFLYPLPSYITSLFYFLGFSLVDSTKIIFGITYILSGLTMYLWVNEFLGKRAAFVSSLLYIFVPYRFVDLYVRGAIGEHVAFVFLPLILYFVLKLSKKYSFWLMAGGAFSIAGLILSHNAISLMFLPIIFLYAFYLLWQSNRKKLLVIGYWLLVIFGFSLSAFFWVPAFFEGKYTLRDIVTAGEYASRFVPFQSFFYGEWNYGISGQFTTQVGIVHWLMIILNPIAIFIFYKKKNVFWILGVVIFFIFWLILFLMTQTSGFVWENISILQKFQFPWRFLSVTVFTTAVIGGLVISVIPKKFQLVSCYLLLVALLWFNKDYWHAKDYQLKAESFYTGVYKSTTDTGESSPRWSVRFMEEEAKAHIEVIGGKAKIKELDRKSIRHVYEIASEDGARIRENTLYFPGWEVLVYPEQGRGIDGKKTNIEFQDPGSRGLITFFVDKGKHLVEVRFKETRLRLFADFISGISLGILLFYSILKAILWQRFQ